MDLVAPEIDYTLSRKKNTVSQTTNLLVDNYEFLTVLMEPFIKILQLLQMTSRKQNRLASYTTQT
jgi:hypothetical protein